MSLCVDPKNRGPKTKWGLATSIVALISAVLYIINVAKSYAENNSISKSLVSPNKNYLLLVVFIASVVGTVLLNNDKQTEEECRKNV
jgi:hypothetical protein